MKVGMAINHHKAFVVPVFLGLMWFFNNWSTKAFIQILGKPGMTLETWLKTQKQV